MVICRQLFSEVAVQTNVHQWLSHPRIQQIIRETVIESLERNALVRMAQQLKGVEGRLVEIRSSLEVIAGGQELFFRSTLNLTRRMGQAFMPIMYSDFGLPIEELSPPTDQEETLDETPSEEELWLTRKVKEDKERWRTR